MHSNIPGIFLMKSIKYVIATTVFTIAIASAAHAAPTPDTNLALIQDHQDQITANKTAADASITTLNSEVSRLSSEKADKTQANMIGALAAQNSLDISDNQQAITNNTAAINNNTSHIDAVDHAQQLTEMHTNTNTKDIADLKPQIAANTDGVQRNMLENQAQQAAIDSHGDRLNDHEQRIETLENQPKPTNGKDGVDGKDGAKGDTGAQGVAGANGKDGTNGKDGLDGKDGVTTTLTKKEVDTATQAKVAANTNAITTTATQSATVAKDLEDAKRFFIQQQADNNAQFKSLKDEVDANKKEARSGAASAIAIASMPQVEKEQAVMFSAGVGSFKDEQALSVGASFHAGEHAIIKAGISDSTNNDLAMGAGVGIGF